MWRHAEPATRRYTLTVAGSLLTVLGLGYVTFAVLKGELMPGAKHVSLVDGILFQLVQRPGGGSVLDRTSQAGDTVDIWLQLDWVLPAAATLCAVLLLAVRRMRPIAAAYLFPLVMMLRPGYLPVPYLVAMLPFAALLVAAAVDLGVRRRGALRIAAVTAAVASAAVAVPVWAAGISAMGEKNMDGRCPVRSSGSRTTSTAVTGSSWTTRCGSTSSRRDSRATT